jgi:GTP-binding protein
MPLPKVVIVGRPNVGKSSLLNWLAGRRISIVDDVAGVTRDRISALVQIGDDKDAQFLELVDTGGIGMVDRDDLSEHVDNQIDAALTEADLILFVVDVREGLMPLDEEVASRLRYVNKPVILVVNKADTPEYDDRGGDFYKLGRGKPIYVSVKQNRNQKVLLKMIKEEMPEDGFEKPAEETMKVAVVGRPNTGKSTFINTLAHAERMIVSEVAGTTRDSVDVQFELDGLPFIAIDTAGVRRKAKIRDDLDFYSIHRAERSIRRADIVLLFIDPTQGISRLDKQLADYIAKQYKPCVFVINKWDLITANPSGPSSEAMQKTANGVQHAFRTMAYAPVAFITAKTGRNVKALLNLSQAMFKQAQRRVGTSALNRVLREAVEAHPPAMRENRTPKIYYATQVGTAPPTVVLFVNKPSLFDATYQRYLLNVFRQKLPFRDVPMKLYLRARTQTDPNAPGEATDPTADSGPRAGRSEPVWVGDLDREIDDLLADDE